MLLSSVASIVPYVIRWIIRWIQPNNNKYGPYDWLRWFRCDERTEVCLNVYDYTYIPHGDACLGEAYKKQIRASREFIPFSAFWLRSSVVSVLISLISDTWPIRPHDINLISFMGAAPARGSLLLLGVACVASALH